MRAILFLILAPLVLNAQSDTDGNAFISHAMLRVDTSLQVKSYESVYFPWIEEYELRTETNDLDWQRQEYVLRLSPSSPKKRKAQQRMYSLLQAKPDVELRKSFCRKTTEVHADWISLFIIDKQKDLLKQLNKVLDDKAKVYDKYIGIYAFDFQKMISLEQNRTELALNEFSLENERAYILEKYNLGQVQFNYSSFISIQQILDQISTQELIADKNDELEDAYELDLINAEIDLELAEREQFLDFVQLRYQGPHDDLIEERLSFGMGIRLPHSGNRKIKLKELQLEADEIYNDQEFDQSEATLDLRKLKTELEKSIRVYHFYNKKISEERKVLKNLASKIAAQEGYNPISLLNVEERAISNQIDSVQLLEDIIFDYLNYLKRSGQICAAELKNYLEMP